MPNLTKYEFIETEVSYGIFTGLSQAAAKQYEGFTALNIEQQVIGENTIVNVYYKRNIYSLMVFAPAEGLESIQGAGEHLYGEQINLDILLTEKCEFNCWEINYNSLVGFDLTKSKQTFEMPASDIVLTAILSFDYIVNHYLEPIYDLNSSIPDLLEYELVETETFNGIYNSTTNVVSKTHTGFTALDVEQKTISNDTVVNIYYKRNKYYLMVLTPAEGVESIQGAGEHLYGEQVNLDAEITDCYEWKSWEINYGSLVGFDSSKSKQTFEMPASDLVLTISLKYKSFDYIVNHYLEPIYDLNSSIPDLLEYELVETETFNGIYNSTTNVVSKTYTGFTALDVEQKTISNDTVVNIYYKRNKYFLTVLTPVEGVESIQGAGEHLYGEQVNLDAEITDCYEWKSWEINYGSLVGFDLTKSKQTFEMPASDLVLTISLKYKSFDYIVNHYLEPIYDLNSSIPDLLEYELVETETFNGIYNSTTNVVSKTYTGFTALDVEQKTISNDTVVNIYYKRNKYTVSVQDINNGLKNIFGTGEYLYGSYVNLSVNIKDAYNNIAWTLKPSDASVDVQIDGLQQSFVMPSLNLIFVVNLKIKTFLLKVEVIGKGIVTPNSRMVNYGESVNFKFIPEDGYCIKAVYRNNVKIDIASDSYILNTITSPEKITVEFEEVKILDSEQNQDKIEQEDDEQSVNSKTDLDYNIDDDEYIEYLISNVIIWGGIGILVIALISFAVISVIFLRKKH